MNERAKMSPISAEGTPPDRIPGPSLWLRLVSFTLGLAVALTGCALLGRSMSSRNVFHDFRRFHVVISPEALYQPTARQIQHLALDVLDRSRINVIIGGSSVFYGVGQPQGATVVDDLRGELGSEYRVINLAMRGGDVSGIAELAAEMLMREDYRVVYVSDIAILGMPAPIGSRPYQYVYWDAKSRNLLFDWRARDLAVGRPWYTEEVLGARLNSILYFTDLWSTIGYDYVFTVFSPIIPVGFWRPRKDFFDSEIDPPERSRYQNDAENLRIAAALAAQPLTPEASRNVRNSIELAVPEPVLRSTVLAVCENSPWLLDQLPPPLRDNRVAAREGMVALLTEIAAAALSACDGFEKDDYIDRVHLSVRGARKIAPRLAEAVRAVARKNGWME